MGSWYNNKKTSDINFRKLLQERIEKANPRRQLTSDQQQMVEAKKNERANEWE
tara:strand:- start:94 stop:252 length:159 start_codon:yes stop_codon:yes gene_type:complete